MLRLSPAARAVLLIALIPSSAFTQGTPAPSPTAFPPPPVSLDTAGMYRGSAARVGESLYISGQPTEAALRQLRAEGVTTVINLRTPAEMQTGLPFDEAAVLKELGVDYVALPVRGTPEFPYAPSAVDALAAALRDAKGKVLLHCSSGARTSHLWAAYLIRDRGVPVDSALAHARLINFAESRPSAAGRFPVEDFLGYSLPQLRR